MISFVLKDTKENTYYSQNTWVSKIENATHLITLYDVFTIIRDFEEEYLKFMDLLVFQGEMYPVE